MSHKRFFCIMAKSCLLSLSLWLCCWSTNARSATTEYEDLVGKRFLYDYNNGQSYEVSYGSTHVNWKGITGSRAGQAEADRYEAREVAPRVYFIHWRQDDGALVSLVANFNNYKIYHSLRVDSKISTAEGTMRLRPHHSVDVSYELEKLATQVFDPRAVVSLPARLLPPRLAHPLLSANPLHQRRMYFLDASDKGAWPFTNFMGKP